VTFEYSKCEPIENELATKLEGVFFPDDISCAAHIEEWLETKLNNICAKLGIEGIVVTSTKPNSIYLGMYKDGVIEVDHASLRNAVYYLVVGLHELAHHLNEVGGSEYINEIEYNGCRYRMFHGDGFVKALKKVYNTLSEIEKEN